ncbi:MAG: hypothetical protein IT168_20430 [Bryobacterales bacterium]|nr:hypothetical protein [Bryobacterales bacterium]
MPRDQAARYLRDNFDPQDRLAVVLINKRSGSVVQRLATAGQIASAEFQAWLRYQNAQKADVYCTLNTLHPDARGRTKDDIETVRHVYLDFDHDGTAAVERLRHHAGMPEPNYLIGTSPGKWQVTWRVQGFTKAQAEDLQRGMAREFGADPAATDCSRVLRVPGFYNHKYTPTHYVRVKELSRETYSPEHFPKLESGSRGTRLSVHRDPNPPSIGPGHHSQSERDWAFARRALARGEAPEAVATAIAAFRHGEKANVADYAERTVRKALESLNAPEASAPER